MPRHVHPDSGNNWCFLEFWFSPAAQAILAYDSSRDFSSLFPPSFLSSLVFCYDSQKAKEVIFEGASRRCLTFLISTREKKSNSVHSILSLLCCLCPILWVPMMAGLICTRLTQSLIFSYLYLLSFSLIPFATLLTWHQIFICAHFLAENHFIISPIVCYSSQKLFPPAVPI